MYTELTNKTKDWMRSDKQMVDVETKFYGHKTFQNEYRTFIPTLSNQNDGFRGNATEIVHLNVCNESFNNIHHIISERKRICAGVYHLFIYVLPLDIH